jgi:hypothetical protein
VRMEMMFHEMAVNLAPGGSPRGGHGVGTSTTFSAAGLAGFFGLGVFSSPAASASSPFLAFLAGAVFLGAACAPPSRHRACHAHERRR